jgi:hypothetical protein
MLSEFFGITPTVLVFPGDAWTTGTLERALELDLLLVASYYVALRDSGRFCWAEQVCSPYLDEPERGWFAAGVPVVGYFHARDVAERGASWVSELLDRWSSAGARRLIGLRELAVALNSRVRFDDEPAGAKLTIRTPPSCARGRLRVRLRCSTAPTVVSAEIGGRARTLHPTPSGGGSFVVDVTL